MEACSIYGDIKTVRFLIDHKADFINKDSDINNALDKACENNHIDILKLLLDNVNDIKKEGGRVLIKAITKRYFDIIHLLIDRGVDPFIYYYGRNCLTEAVSINCIDSMKWIIEKGIKIGSDDGGRALLEINSDKQYEIVKLLIENGANVNFKDGKGKCPILVVSSLGCLNIAKLLIEKGADIKSDGDPALFEACSNGYIEIAALLIENGADVNYKDKIDRSVLMKATSEGHLDIAKLLISKGADIAFRSRNDRNVFSEACLNGQTEIANLLIQSGIDFDHDKEKALMFSISNGHTDVLKLLLNKGAILKKDVLPNLLTDISSKGYFDIFQSLIRNNENIAMSALERPLENAIKKGHIKIVKYILNVYGFDIIRSSYGNLKSLIYFATENGYFNIVRLLVSRGAEVTPNVFVLACSRGYIEIAEFLFSLIKPIFINCGELVEVFDYACANGNVDVVEYLIKKGINIKSESMAPLVSACSHGHLNIARILIQHGVNVNYSLPNDRKNALVYACANGYFGIVKLLVENKANIKHGYNNTPLIQANDYGRTKIAKYLIEHNTNPNIIINRAIESGNVDIIKMLIKSGAEFEKHVPNIIDIVVSLGRVDLLRLLIAKGVKIDDDVDVLFNACKFGHEKTIRLLIDNGLKIDEYIFRVLIRNNQTQIIKILFSCVKENQTITNVLSRMSNSNISLSQIIDIINYVERIGKTIKGTLLFPIPNIETDLVSILLEKGCRALDKVSSKYQIRCIWYSSSENSFTPIEFLISRIPPRAC